ncbi:tetratricopeptide repeat-containing sensor histidine kinase [Flavobacterium poyangense]|uniref:tetratricopeptide repeat-containing sensor histidine kinase n=1 Tax=Flavobacterium poyangense TaxID=2204302 RepID=UPI0014235566|nr:tetratricopeptide repeat-containing sensor histidine kinase [Flavobacterium sp. JXAS1]
MSRGRIAVIFCFLLFGISYRTLAQNQAKADSLKLLLVKNDAISPQAKMGIYAKIAAHSSSPDEVLLYANKLLELASSTKQSTYIIEAYQSKGVAYRLKGNLKMALKNLFKSADLAIEYKNDKLLTSDYLEIANTYTSNNDFKNAIVYNKKAIAVIRLHGNKEQLAINLLNTGFSYYRLHELESALSLYNEAAPIFEEIGLEIGKAYTIGNRALVYWKQGKHTIAEQDLLKAIKMLDLLGDTFGMADYHNQLGRIYSELRQTEKAIDHTLKALNMAKVLDLKEQIRDAALLLSELYEVEKDYPKAFVYQSQYIAYKDSIENTEATKQLANLRTDFEVSQKEKEIALLEKKQLSNRIYIIVTVFLLLFAVLLLLYFRQRFKNTRLMAHNERSRHDEKIKKLLNTQETKALQSMVQGQENERKRIARELHNHFGSLLATIKVNLNAIDEKTISNHHTLSILVDQACTDIRNLSHELNMGISDNFGLVPALKELTSHLQQANELEIEFTASMCQEQLSSENEIIVYRIVQELVSNVLKHAAATKLSILLTCFDDENLMNIIVQDNGKGFNVTEKLKSISGMGLKTLREIILDLQGDIKFDSNPASGTTVNIDLPF